MQDAVDRNHARRLRRAAAAGATAAVATAIAAELHGLQCRGR